MVYAALVCTCFLIGESVKSHGVTDLIDENILNGPPFIELIL